MLRFDGIHVCDICEQALSVWITVTGIYLCDDCAVKGERRSRSNG